MVGLVDDALMNDRLFSKVGDALRWTLRSDRCPCADMSSAVRLGGHALLCNLLVCGCANRWDGSVLMFEFTSDSSIWWSTVL